MKLSIHRIIRGKPTKQSDDDGVSYMSSQGQRVNLGFDWFNIDVEWPDAFRLITEDGCATSAELAGDHRHNGAFVSRELLMVDIDAGMTIPELFDNEFYNEFGAGFYATPSYTDSAPRFRIMFRTPEPITDSEQCRLLIQALMRVYDHADIACKDSTRIFYGTVNCALSECRTNTLTPGIVQQLIQMELVFRQEALAEREQEPAEYAPLTDQRRQRILDLLKQTFVGEYPVWRNVGWGLKRAGFDLQDFQYVTTGMMSQKTAADAAAVWRAGGRSSGEVCTIGTVIHLLRQRHGEDCLDPVTEQIQRIDTDLDLLKRKIEKWQQKQQKTYEENEQD